MVKTYKVTYNGKEELEVRELKAYQFKYKNGITVTVGVAVVKDDGKVIEGVNTYGNVTEINLDEIIEIKKSGTKGEGIDKDKLYAIKDYHEKLNLLNLRYDAEKEKLIKDLNNKLLK